MAKKSKKDKINNMKVFNALNASEREKNYRVFTQPSQTVPDETIVTGKQIGRAHV